MTNNLRKVKQDLCTFAKRVKDFKYTDSALITFLMTGMVSVTDNLFSATENKNIEVQRQEISTSIKNIHKKVKETKKENDKLLKATNLELIQLMEQGDHVVKSNWDSWQFGSNYYYSNYNSVFKGRGDKKEKYPYEGIYKRSLNVYERATSPTSSAYSLLQQNFNPYSALSSERNRKGINEYGLIGTSPVVEPIVGFEVNAAIYPKQVSKGEVSIPQKTVTTPTLPVTMAFSTASVTVNPINIATSAITVQPKAASIGTVTVTPSTPTTPAQPTPVSFAPIAPEITVDEITTETVSVSPTTVTVTPPTVSSPTAVTVSVPTVGTVNVTAPTVKVNGISMSAASVVPKTLTKTVTAPTVAITSISTPTVEPKMVSLPEAPEAPILPEIAIPTFNLAAGSNGNGGRTLADVSSNSNGAIESVVLTKGNFNITRNSNSRMNYSYNNYSGIAPWNTPTTDSGNTFNAGGRSWTNWSRTNGSTGSYLGFQKLVGDGSSTGAMLSNSNNLFTNVSTTTLREFVHLDHHSDATPATILTGFNTGISESTWDSTVSSGSNKTAVVNAFEDLRDNVNSTAAHGNSAVAGSNMYIWMQSGRIVMEGSYNVVSNNYDHNGGGNKKSIASNVGDIVIQPHLSTTGVYSGSKSAIFSLSPGGSTTGHLSIMYNGSTGNMDLWTKESAVFLNSETAGKPISIVNRGTINMYGEKSAGIYNSQYSRMDVQFVDKGFSFNAGTNTATGNYKPINIYGDSSIGIFWDKGNNGSIGGNFAVNIGGTGAGNKNFTTKSSSAVTGGAETNGVAISNYDVNSSDKATVNKDYIRGSFGILSNGNTNLTSHQINIYDKAEGNVGVMPYANALVNIGGGKIQLNGGNTAKNNVGIYTDTSQGGGAVKSKGDVILNNGIGNLAIVSIGSTKPTGSNYNVEVGKVEATNTKNSTVIYASKGATVKASELNISGATVESDASTVNKKNTGAVYATGSGTAVTIDRTALPSAANININGVALTDNSTKFAGFGVYANDNAVINADKNYIKVLNGSTGIASTNNARVNLTNGKLEYNGKGYALYYKTGGTIDISGSNVILDGNATGFQRDASSGTTNLITDASTLWTIKSPNVTLIDLQNYSGGINLSTMKNSIQTAAGLTSLNIDPSSVTGFTLATIDGLSAYNVDTNLSQSTALSNPNSNDAYFYNTIVSRAKLNVLSGSTVTANINKANANSLYSSDAVIALQMSSSGNASSNDETQINLKSGSTVTANGNDTNAIGLFINYGKVNTEANSVINVGTTSKQAKNVGVYAVNGSQVTTASNADINTDGSQSIGILGLAYRTNTSGNLVVNEFGTLTGQGDISVKNAGNITAKGDSSVGIYVQNNDNRASGTRTSHNIESENTGTITMTGGSTSIGMLGIDSTSLKNSGTIDQSATTAIKSVGMYGTITGNTETTSTNINNTGKIYTGTSTQSNRSIGIFSDVNSVNIINNGIIAGDSTLSGGDFSYGISGHNITLQNNSDITVGNDGLGVYASILPDPFNAGKSTTSTVNIGGKITVGDSKNDYAIGVLANNDSVSKFGSSYKQTVNDSNANFKIGKDGFGYVLLGDGEISFSNSSGGTVLLDKDSVYLYSTNSNSNTLITNNHNFSTTEISNDGINVIYAAGKVVNNGTVDLSNGIGNVGITSVNSGTATNNAKITVGPSNITVTPALYGIGMVGNQGNVINTSTIEVGSDNSLGMYAEGTAATAGSALNSGTITLKNTGKNMTGMYAANYGTASNKGTIEVASNITKVASGNQEYNAAIRAGGTNSAAINGYIDSKTGAITAGTVKLLRDYTIGIFGDQGKVTNAKGSSIISNTESNNSIGLAGTTGATVTNNGTITLKGSSGKGENTGVYLKNSSATTSSDSAITVSGGDKNIAVYLDGSKITSFGGSVNSSADSYGAYGLVLENGSTVTGAGTGATVTVTGGSKKTGVDATTKADIYTGSVGIAVLDSSSNVSGDIDLTATLTGTGSVGLYAKSGTLSIDKADINANSGATNFFSDGNKITIGNQGSVSTAVTGKDSVLFATENGGKIRLGGKLNATVNAGGTAFYYTGTTFNATTISTMLDNTQSNLDLTMATDSRMAVADGITMKVSDSDLGATGITINSNSGNYKSFAITHGNIIVDIDSNLDSTSSGTAALYRRLDLQSSDITNETGIKITGTQTNQNGMAQESDSTKTVTLTNKGEITLSGTGSTAMYTKSGILNNASTGKITVGESSVGMFGLHNTDMTNAAGGKITVGKSSVGMYYSDIYNDKDGNPVTVTTTKGLTNAGAITSTAEKAVGMTYEPQNIGTGSVSVSNTGSGVITPGPTGNGISLTGDGSIGIFAKVSKDNKTYDVTNSGDILVGKNSSVGMYTNEYTDASNVKRGNKLINTGKIKTDEKSVGMYGYEAQNSGTITVGNNQAVGIYSQGGNVTLASGSKIVVGENKSAGVFLASKGQTLTNAGNFEIGKESYGIVNTNTDSTTGNTINSTGGTADLKGKALFIYSTDTKGSITNATAITTDGTDGENYGIYAAGTVSNSANITLDKSGATTGNGNIGIYSFGGQTKSSAANTGTITVGFTDVSNKLYSIGMVANDGNVTNNTGGTINVNHDNSLGMYSKTNSSTGTNKGTINIGTNSSRVTGMFADENSTMTNAAGGIINVNSTITKAATGTQPYNAAMRANGTGSSVINENTINLNGPYTMGMFAAKGSAKNTGTIGGTSANNSLGIAADGASNVIQTATGSVSLTGANNIGLYLKSSTASSIEGTFEVKGNNGIGIYGKDGKITSYKAKTTADGNGVYGLVLSGTSSVTGDGTGEIIIKNGSGAAGITTDPLTSKNRGSVGIATLDSTSTVTGVKLSAKVKDKESIGVYAKGDITLTNADVEADDKAVNFFANGAKITIGGGTTKTGDGSLLFYATNGGKIDLTGNVKANVDKGTAIYYKGGEYDSKTNTITYTAFSPSSTITGMKQNLDLIVQNGGRTFVGEGVEIKISDTNPTALFKTYSNSGGKSFLLYHSKLDIDTDVNLDTANNLYDSLELASSSVTNNKVVTGTAANKTFMAQENDTQNINVVTLKNSSSGKIDLSGNNSTAMYAKYGVLTNEGEIKVNGVAMYGVNNAKITNTKDIVLFSNSTGMYYNDVETAKSGTTVYNTKESLINEGTIKSNGTISDTAAMIYAPGNSAKSFENKGTIELTGNKNTGMYAKVSDDNTTYDVKNSGTIKLGNSSSASNRSVGMYTDTATNGSSTFRNKLVNTGKISLGDYAVGMYGYEIENSGNITVGDAAVGIYSLNGDVNLTAGEITVGNAKVSDAAVGIYTSGTGQTVTNSGTQIKTIGTGSFGYVNRGTGNTLNITTAKDTTLNGNATFIYSDDTTGTVKNSSVLKTSGTTGGNYGIYAAGTVENNANMTLTDGDGNIGIFSIKGGTATHKTGTITVGSSNTGSNSYGIGMVAGITDTAVPANNTTGKIINEATITVAKDNSLGMYSTQNGSTGENKGNIKVSADNTTGMFADNSSTMTNSSTIEVNSSTTDNNYAAGMRAANSGTSKNAKDIKLSGKYTIGMFAGKNGTVENNENIITAGTVSNSLGIAGKGTGAAVKNNKAIVLAGGTDNVGLYTADKATAQTSSASSITLTGDNGIGLYVDDATISSYGGKTDVTGKGTYGLVISNNGGTVTGNGGKINVKGTGETTYLDAGITKYRGSAGIVALGGSTTGDIDLTASVDGKNSVGIYSKNANVSIDEANTTTVNGAINYYTDNGTITIGNASSASKSVTGKGSLLFYNTNGGKITLTGTLNATVQGGSDAASRGTAFYYKNTSGSPVSWSSIVTAISNEFNNSLGKLNLTLDSGSRLMSVESVKMNLSDTNISTGGFSSLGANAPTITDNGAKSFMLNHSDLTIDNNVNLDNDNDLYNKLEIATSNITNNAGNVITGTKANQTVMAQESDSTFTVKLENKGTINLSGTNSIAMYTNKGTIANSGKISVGDNSVAVYGVNNSDITTASGTISLGNNSTGIYYSDVYTDSNGNKQVASTVKSLINAGTIDSAGNKSSAMIYEPGNISASVTFENTGTINLTGDSNTAMFAKMAKSGNYTTTNTGTITLGNSASLQNPNVGMYTDADKTGTNPLINTGTIQAGNNSIGMYGYEMENKKDITVGDTGIAMYSKNGNVNLSGGKISVGNSEAVAVYTVGSEQKITNTGTTFNIGNGSFGYVNVGSKNTITNSNSSAATLTDNSIFIYSSDAKGKVINYAPITSTGTTGKNYAIYSAGDIENHGNITLTNGVGNIGIYAVKGGTATNAGIISVGASDPDNELYSIAMAAGYDTKDTGHIVNNGTLNVNGVNSIGMYASGNGSTATNNKDIFLNANGAIGMYVESGAKAVNNANISTLTGGYSNVVGVVLGRGAKLENNGVITINSMNGAGIYLKGGIVENYGTINVSGGAKKENDLSNQPTTKVIPGSNVEINAPSGALTATIKVNNIPVTPATVTTPSVLSGVIGSAVHISSSETAPATVTTIQKPISVSASSIGLYVNTSGTNYTNAITNLGEITSEADLILGNEITQSTNSKYIHIDGDSKILEQYNKAISDTANRNVAWNIYSGSLTWMGTVTIDQSNGVKIANVYLAKIPYTQWASNSKETPVNKTDTYNFTDGLEQRYGVDALGSRENQLFDKLNSIGNNEEILLYQAFDEMMGHQYGNVQQRIYSTGSMLDKEFTYLQKDWRNPTKRNNKIKVFGMKDEYKTDTAGIIDYTSNSYGVAYVHENERIKMGNSSGWYAGAVTNKFKFKDIGKSEETQNIIKAGIFKTMSPKKDYNGALQWTISGDVFAGTNEMKRNFLVVDEIFNAEANYSSYGAALKNEIGYNVRLSERMHLKPYGALKMEYGKFSDIKEDRGEMRLEIEGNDYFSVKPEVGMEFKYIQPLAVKTNLSVGLTAAYENELGKVGDINNRGRVRYTTADWFGIRGEKEDRRGSGKFDLNIGVDNTRFGVTVNAGYDTKGKNARGGIGFRAIY